MVNSGILIKTFIRFSQIGCYLCLYFNLTLTLILFLLPLEFTAKEGALSGEGTTKRFILAPWVLNKAIVDDIVRQKWDVKWVQDERHKHTKGIWKKQQVQSKGDYATVVF